MASDDDFNWEGFIEDFQLSARFKDLRAIAAFAIACGWNPVRSKTGKGLIFVAEDGTQILLPRNSHLKLSVFRHHVNTIARHRSLLTGETGLMGAPLGVIVGEMLKDLKLDPDHVRILREALPTAEAAVAVPVPAETGGIVAATEPAPAVQERTPEPEQVTVGPLHVVSSEPWSAHGRRLKDGGSETYPSDAVMQRNWSDGSTDYVCRGDSCDWTHPQPTSVARHYAAKHSRGRGKQPLQPADGVDPDWDPPVRRRRIAKLRGEVDGALIAAFTAGVEADAEFIATWIIDHRPDPESHPRVDGEGGHYDESGGWIADPLTPEQILEEMAALLERRTGRAKVLREQIEAQDAVLQQYQEERDAAVSRAERAEGNLHALRDMLNEADD